jgi:hypothetical protein
MHNEKTACGRYLTYLKNASVGTTTVHRILIREKDVIPFESHEKLDEWHHENRDRLAADEQVSSYI